MCSLIECFQNGLLGSLLREQRKYKRKIDISDERKTKRKYRKKENIEVEKSTNADRIR